MELKFSSSDALHCIQCSSNRTFMELKFYVYYTLIGYVYCSNRTFMELKLCCFDDFTRLLSSNRTFMELKFRKSLLSVAPMLF